jgi:guanylate kinase
MDSQSLHMPTSRKIIIITAPSGAGKTSITHYLLHEIRELIFSISATTRPPRAGETDKKDYYFISPDAFQQKIRDGLFVEWEMVYEGKYYGTLKSELDRIWSMGKVPLLDIDVKGAIHVQQQYRQDSLSIFVEPPSVQTLKTRLESRGSETAETLQARLNKAAYEISFKHSFDKVVVNEHLDTACHEAEAIVRGFIQ